MNIRKLILEGENVGVDFKKTISNCEKIAKTLVAFANNQGGMLLIGVADDGAVKGVKSEEEERFMITKAAHIYCKPAIEPEFEEVYIDHKTVLVAKIPQSDTKPHYALDENQKWWVYFRVKDKSVLASKILVDVLKKGKLESNLLSYTEQDKVFLQHLKEYHRATLKELSKLTRSSYRNAQKTIVNLILMGSITPHISEKEEYYTLSD